MGLLSRKTKRDCLSGTGVELLRGRHYWQQWLLAFILSSLVYIPSRLEYARGLISAEYVLLLLLFSWNMLLREQRSSFSVTKSAAT